MTTRPATIWLTSGLEPLQPFLDRSDVTDIWVNRPGEVWVEALGGGTERWDVPELGGDKLLRLIRQIAAQSAQGINRAHPILSASLPTGERIQVVMPPATRGEIALAIRKYSLTDMRLGDYAETGSFGGSVGYGDALDTPPPRFVGDPMEVLCRAVRERRNFLVSGGTSSGKTTFLNALIAEIPEEERLIVIEDTPEIRMNHPNMVGLLAARGALGEAAVTPEDLLIASLRMRPDRVILGEIRGAEAATFLRAINTGHPGSMSTIHADSPSRAIDQLALLVLQTGLRVNWEDVVTYVRRSVDFIVQLERRAGQRTISEILCLR